MKKNIKKNIEKIYKADEVLIMLESIDDNVAVIAEQHLSINNRLDSIDNRLDNMQSDLDIVKSDVSDIKYDLRQKVSYDEFEKMEKRVLKLEKLVSAKF
ncbi:MAG: hypothetical protein WC682_03555 [Parcubacteria group bacterium]|jgi:tetrahydromethanopterin S-methyltransferase subunit G